MHKRLINMPKVTQTLCCRYRIWVNAAYAINCVYSCIKVLMTKHFCINNTTILSPLD